jgi:hypothetical protein
VETIDEIKVRSVVALSDDLHGLDPSDARYTVVLDRLDRAWRALAPAEQDEVDRVLGQRGPSKRLRIVQLVDGAEGE